MRLFHGARVRAGSEDGSALILALLALMFLSVSGLALVSIGMTELSLGTNWRGYSQAFYAAEAGLESGVVSLRALLAQTSIPTDSQLSAITAPTLTTSGLSFTAFSVTRVIATSPYSYQTKISSGPYAGLSGVVTDYRINAQVTGQDGTRANLTQVLQYVQVPLFQFGVFYGRGVDLEIAPGPNMTFNGRVHANSHIYVGAGSSLRFDSSLTAAGNIYRRIKRDDDIPWGNNPQIKDANGTYQTLNFDHDYRPGFGSQWASPSEWRAQAESVFGPGGKPSTVQDGAMGVSEIIPPIPELFYNPSNPDVVAHQMIELPQGSDPPELQAAKLYSKAGLRIVNGSVTDGNGNHVTLPPDAVTTETFYDAREQRRMNVTQVDVGRLAASGLAPANGVLYVGRSGGGDKAVRLVNGAALPSQGLTVVSPNPVYIQGDYNTFNKVPAAVLADAITVLSNNWGPNNSDAKGNQVTNNRPATTTTVNAALALGPSAESQPNQGNGQLENLIRFLENWSGRTFTYSGSIIALWHSQQATAPWQCCGSGGSQYYSPPTRNWSYDTLFNNNPPPQTPSGVIVMKGPWSQG